MNPWGMVKNATTQAVYVLSGLVRFAFSKEYLSESIL